MSPLTTVPRLGRYVYTFVQLYTRLINTVYTVVLVARTQRARRAHPRPTDDPRFVCRIAAPWL